MTGEEQTINDTPPNRLSSDPRSPHYDSTLLERGVGITFNGAEKTNVSEYCVTIGGIALTRFAGGGRSTF